MRVSRINHFTKRKSDVTLVFRLVLPAMLLALCVGAVSGVGTEASQYRLGYEPAMARIQTILGNNDLPVPEWEEVFNPDGTLRDPIDTSGTPLRNGVPACLMSSGGFEAVYIPDIISNGIGIDMSAFKGGANLSDSVVYNGTVEAGHDLGNAYFYAVKNTKEHLVLYGAVERLGAPDVDSYVEFEFNQGVVQVQSGAPWLMHGTRTSGDILVRITYTSDQIRSAEIKVWKSDDAGGSFIPLTTSMVGASESCGGTAGVFAFCGAARMQLDPQVYQGFEHDLVFDLSGHPVDVPAPDSLVHMAVDVAGVLGMNVEFSSIQVRTPQDVILGAFENMGYWKTHRNEGLATDRQ